MHIDIVFRLAGFGNRLVSGGYPALATTGQIRADNLQRAVYPAGGSTEYQKTDQIYRR